MNFPHAYALATSCTCEPQSQSTHLVSLPVFLVFPPQFFCTRLPQKGRRCLFRYNHVTTASGPFAFSPSSQHGGLREAGRVRLDLIPTPGGGWGASTLDHLPPTKPEKAHTVASNAAAAFAVLALVRASRRRGRRKQFVSWTKKKNKKGKTLTLTDFLAEDGGTFVPKPVSWADETDDLEGDVSTTWHSNDDDVYRAPPIDRSILPTAPRAAREPNIDRSRLPKSPPYTAFLGNLPYDVTEESIKDFFRGLNISAVRLPREPSNPDRLKGFGYAEFEDLESLLHALSLNEE
ncbi:Eukaryotic translation initiation factor 4B, partial [Varanus komodoensis]